MLIIAVLFIFTFTTVVTVEPKIVQLRVKNCQTVNNNLIVEKNLNIFGRFNCISTAQVL